MEDVTYIRNLVWSHATLHQLYVSGITTSTTRVGAWKLAVEKVTGNWEVVFFEKNTTRIQGIGFTVLNEFTDLEIDSDDKLELSATTTMPPRTFAGLLSLVQNSFTAQAPTL